MSRSFAGNVSGRLLLKQRPSGTHAAQKGDVARDAVRREMLQCADRRAEQVQHPCRGGDEPIGVSVQLSQLSYRVLQSTHNRRPNKPGALSLDNECW